MDLKPPTPLPGMVPSASREDLSGFLNEEQFKQGKDIVKEVIYMLNCFVAQYSYYTCGHFEYCRAYYIVSYPNRVASVRV